MVGGMGVTRLPKPKHLYLAVTGSPFPVIVVDAGWLLGCPVTEVRINGERINGLFHLEEYPIYK